MSRFVSGERRGAILLVVIIAVIIAVIAITDRSKPLPPAVPPPTITPVKETGSGSDSVVQTRMSKKKTDKTRRKSERDSRHRRSTPAHGKHREYLDEPVAPATSPQQQSGQ